MKLEDNLLKSIKKVNHREIIIWGANLEGLAVLDVLGKMASGSEVVPKVAFFIDKDAENQGIEFHGLDVLAPRDIATTNKKYFVIIATPRNGLYMNEMQSLGFEYGSDFVFSSDDPQAYERKKIAIVTGSTKGIGKAISLNLLAEGYHVLMNYHKDDKAAQKLSEDLLKQGYQKEDFSIIRADLSEESGLDVMIKYIHENYSSIDCLVYNNKVSNMGVRFSECTREIWIKTMNANLNFCFFLVHDLRDIMNDNGRIIFISSSASKSLYYDVPYSVSKAAMNKMGMDIMPFFAKRGITVNTICPRSAYTAYFEKRDKVSLANLEKRLTLKRMSQPEEVASLAMHLIHNANMTGAVIDCGFCDKI